MAGKKIVVLEKLESYSFLSDFLLEDENRSSSKIVWAPNKKYRARVTDTNPLWYYKYVYDYSRYTSNPSQRLDLFRQLSGWPGVLLASEGPFGLLRDLNSPKTQNKKKKRPHRTLKNQRNCLKAAPPC